jgi:predicted enzyme related to lactoylglutathione lyase
MGSLVIFSVDVHRLAAFYEAVLEVSPTDEPSDDIRLLNDRVEVWIHSIPSHIANTIEITVPPEAREDSAVKPVFDVGSLEHALNEVRANGGVVTGRSFSLDGLTRHDVLDPDGNVIQLRGRGSLPSGTERARAFLPTKDFEVSKEFYLALGFTLTLDSDVAIFATGESEIILTRFYQKEYAENFMMQLLVDDLDGWWAHISSLNLPERFGIPAPREPSVQPWGLRVAYVVDPCGVLWHLAQRPGDDRIV